MTTPHNTAEVGDFAPAVIMPGDPKRARRIAELLMPDAREVSSVRGIGAYTGTVDGKPLSVMASGMGHPSIGIYATELFKFYNVERIIRVGTTGGLRLEAKLGDVIIAIGAHTDSSFNDALIPNIRFAPTASWELLKAAVDAGEGLGGLHIAPIFSSDHFYDNPPEQAQMLADFGVMGIDMETAALYAIAARYGKQALSVLTVSDNLVDHSQDMSAEERERNFTKALDLAIAAAFC